MPAKGRPHTLDAAKCDEICDLVASGHTVNAVARSLGCNVKTIRRHAARDEQFGARLRTVELTAQQDPLKMVRRAARGNWRAAAWLLERTEPERYSKRPPATCQPEQVEAAFARLIDTALIAIKNKAECRPAYLRLSQIAEEETLRLFLPPSAKQRTSPFTASPAIEEQQLHDYVDNCTQFIPR